MFTVVLALATLGTGKARFVSTEGWLGQCGDAQHTAQSQVVTDPLQKIQWSTPIDLNPRYQGNSLLTHYGSPCISSRYTLITPVKQNLDGGFNICAFDGVRHLPLWTAATDYVLPSASWIPSCGPCLIGNGQTDQTVAWPMAGGRVAFRSANAKLANTTVVAFYGNSVYNSDPGSYNSNIKICTPLTPAPDGAVYFGFVATGSTVAGLQSGIAKVYQNGTGTWVAAAAASNDSGVAQVKINGAPALTLQGDAIYVTLSSGGFGHGCLAKLNASTLAPITRVALKDPKNGNDAIVEDLGTGCPMIGPDGDVYVGVLENPFGSNGLRGWMLHFTGDLATQKVSGAFGWDDTPSVVPASAVPSYHGQSTYLLCTKYNNYVSGGGDGVNKIALLDPNVAATEAVSGAQMMKEIATIAGPTPDQDFVANHPNAVREWCVNTAAVDVPKKSVILNCEDGYVYRWDLTTFTLSEKVKLTDGIGEAYTSTVIGPDGHIYAISNARLYIVGSKLMRL